MPSSGDAFISAATTDPAGQVADRWIVSFEQPIAQVSFGEWGDGGNGQKQQQVAATVTYDDQPVSNLALSLRKKVTDGATGNDAPAQYQNAAQLAATTGTTDANGVFTTTLIWTPPPDDPGADPRDYKISAHVNAPGLSGKE